MRLFGGVTLNRGLIVSVAMNTATVDPGIGHFDNMDIATRKIAFNAFFGRIVGCGISKTHRNHESVTDQSVQIIRIE